MDSKVYFPGLNGLRFLAAAFVFLHHVEQHKFWLGLSNTWGFSLIDNIGHQARVIFFVLSGFLITYLFLVEIEKTGTVNWKKFQIRRALRLWPVYYLVVLISIFVLPSFINIKTFNLSLENNFTKELVIYMLMLPNLARLMPPIMGANQFWSVGVQEQFYFIWPLAVRFFIKSFIPFLLCLIAFKMIVEAGLITSLSLYEIGSPVQKVLKQILQIWQLLLFEQMAVGALGAYLFFYYKDKASKFIYHPIAHIVSLCIFLVLLFAHLNFVGYTVIQAAIAFVLIINISNNPRFFIKLEGSVLNYLGNLSFGMYAYHTACIAIVISILTKFNLHISSNTYVFNIMLYGFSFLLTLLLSALSYRYFEDYFLKLKKKFKPSKESPVKLETQVKETT